MSISTFDLLLNHTIIIRIEQSSHPTNIQSIIVPHSCCLVDRCLLTEDHVLLVLILVTVIIITLGHVHHVVAFEGFVYAFVQSLYFLLWDCHLLCYLLMIAMVCVLWDTWKDILVCMNVCQKIVLRAAGLLLSIVVEHPWSLVGIVRLAVLDSCVSALFVNWRVVEELLPLRLRHLLGIVPSTAWAGLCRLMMIGLNVRLWFRSIVEWGLRSGISLVFVCVLMFLILDLVKTRTSFVLVWLLIGLIGT